jgi:ketosteroid isomerase-like protein
MSENLRIAQQGYERFGSGDVEGLLELLSSDIKWTVPEIENAEFGGLRTSVPEVGKFFQQLVEDEDIQSFEPREFIAQGDRVVVLGHSIVVVRATGKRYETDWVHIFRMADGKITEFTEFFDNAAASRAHQMSAAA